MRLMSKRKREIYLKRAKPCEDWGRAWSYESEYRIAIADVQPISDQMMQYDTQKQGQYGVVDDHAYFAYLDCGVEVCEMDGICLFVTPESEPDYYAARVDRWDGHMRVKLRRRANASNDL